MKIGSTKIIQNTEWIDQKCMLFKACMFTILLLAQEKCTLQKCVVFFFNWAHLFQTVFHHMRDAQKKSAPRGPFSDFWEAEMGPRAHLGIRGGGGPFGKGDVVCV